MKASIDCIFTENGHDEDEILDSRQIFLRSRAQPHLREWLTQYVDVNRLARNITMMELEAKTYADQASQLNQQSVYLRQTLEHLTIVGVGTEYLQKLAEFIDETDKSARNLHLEVGKLMNRVLPMRKQLKERKLLAEEFYMVKQSVSREDSSPASASSSRYGCRTGLFADCCEPAAPG